MITAKIKNQSWLSWTINDQSQPNPNVTPWRKLLRSLKLKVLYNYCEMLVHYLSLIYKIMTVWIKLPFNVIPGIIRTKWGIHTGKPLWMEKYTLDLTAIYMPDSITVKANKISTLQKTCIMQMKRWLTLDSLHPADKCFHPESQPIARSQREKCSSWRHLSQ